MSWSLFYRAIVLRIKQLGLFVTHSSRLVICEVLEKWGGYLRSLPYRFEPLSKFKPVSEPYGALAMDSPINRPS